MYMQQANIIKYAKAREYSIGQPLPNQERMGILEKCIH